MWIHPHSRYEGRGSCFLFDQILAEPGRTTLSWKFEIVFTHGPFVVSSRRKGDATASHQVAASQSYESEDGD